MAASVTTTITTVISGLGNEDTMTVQFSPAAPTVSFHSYKTITTPSTPERLDFGALTTITGIWIRAIGYDLQIDPTYSSSFTAKLLVPAGQAAYFRPASGASVYVDCASAGSYEYVVLG